MRRRSIVLALAAAAALAMLLRDGPRRDDLRQLVSFRAMPHPARIGRGVEIEAAWLMTSPHAEFGSYSALAALDRSRLAAYSDRGARLIFARPDRGGDRARPLFDLLAGTRRAAAKRERDCEAVTRDPVSGTMWAAYERGNSIVRFGPDGAITGRVRPRAMRGWPANRGPEAMVRLADGRFILLAEDRASEGRHRALLFARDPIEGGTPLAFEYAPPDGFRPTDIAELPDGRVVVLNRELLFPWRFRMSLSVLDPREIRAAKVWRGREIARLGPSGPAENYEGLAIVARADGHVTLWVISDDNQAALVQRTLLLKLVWRPDSRRKPA